MGFLTRISPRTGLRPTPRRIAIGGILAGTLAAFACTGGGTRSAPTADPESILWGGGRCQEGTECASGLCSVGLCLGYIAGSSEEARATVAPALARVAAAPGGEAVEALLADALADRSSDPFVRGRAADAFRHLPAGAALRVLPPYLDDPDEPVRFFAARALAAARDARGRDALMRFREHQAEAVRLLARRALGEAVDPAPLPVRE